MLPENNIPMLNKNFHVRKTREKSSLPATSDPLDLILVEVIKLFLRVVDGVVGADEVGRISGAIVDGLANVDDSVLFIASNITEIFALITNNARRIDSFHPRPNCIDTSECLLWKRLPNFLRMASFLCKTSFSQFAYVSIP